MSPDLQSFISTLFSFFLGIGIGYVLRVQRYEDEVREWKHIARQAQRLNNLPDTLAKERSNGSGEHAHQPDRDN